MRFIIFNLFRKDCTSLDMVVQKSEEQPSEVSVQRFSCELSKR